MEVLQTVEGVNIQDDNKTFDPYHEAANSHHISMSNNILALYSVAIVIESNGPPTTNKETVKIHNSFCACDPTLLL